VQMMAGSCGSLNARSWNSVVVVVVICGRGEIYKNEEEIEQQIKPNQGRRPQHPRRKPAGPLVA